MDEVRGRCLLGAALRFCGPHTLGCSVPALNAISRSRFVLYSEATLLEIAETLFKKKFDKYFSAAARSQILSDFERIATCIQGTTTIEACRHPKDDKFLELAVDGNADLILSGDQDLLVLSPFRGIPIVTPTQYLVED